jgi:UDP-N-acetylmuramoyl-tripeptide--D-alanyl-D-alanine ligase
MLAAITGSNGKTTTKQMLRSICGFAGPTCATQGNLNNHVGLPLSLLELEPVHRFGVFELGASARGEIALLTRLCRPDAAVLTNVSEAHLGLFGSLEAVFETKAELARESRGPVALNADDPRLAALLPELGARAVPFGRAAGSRVKVEDSALVVDGRRVPLSGAAAEPVNRVNAAAAAAGALALGLGWREIAPGLAHFSPPPMRMERRRHPTGALIVLDAYNANPASMRASLESFLETCGRPRRIAVLGDMKELGPASAEAHRQLGRWLAGRGLSEVYLAGPEIRPAAEELKAAGGKAVWAEDPLAFAPELKRGLGPDAALFLKASRAIALERLLEKL